MWNTTPLTICINEEGRRPQLRVSSRQFSRHLFLPLHSQPFLQLPWCVKVLRRGSCLDWFGIWTFESLFSQHEIAHRREKSYILLLSSELCVLGPSNVFINLFFFSLRWKVDLIIYQLQFYLVQNEASKPFPQASEEKTKLLYFANTKKIWNRENSRTRKALDVLHNLSDFLFLKTLKENQLSEERWIWEQEAQYFYKRLTSVCFTLWSIWIRGNNTRQTLLYHEDPQLSSGAVTITKWVEYWFSHAEDYTVFSS